MIQKNRKKISWAAGQRPSRPDRLPLHTAQIPLSQPELYVEKLIPGTFFITNAYLDVIPQIKGYTAPPVSYVVEAQTLYGNKIIMKGSVAVYAGNVRVEESLKDGSTISVLRPAFIINSSKYITHDLNTFTPA